MTRRGLALAVMLITLAAAGTALAQGFGASASDRVFQVTWNAATTRRGQPAIEGYVANQTGYSYRFIELAVDGTDAGGRPLPRPLLSSTAGGLEAAPPTLKNPCRRLGENTGAPSAPSGGLGGGA